MFVVVTTGDCKCFDRFDLLRLSNIYLGTQVVWGYGLTDRLIDRFTDYGVTAPLSDLGLASLGCQTLPLE
jgi:hypothetical protein